MNKVMDNKLLRIINEEISGYQYLSLDNIKEEDNTDATLNSREFQTRLIHDIMNKVIKVNDEGGVIDDIEDNGFGDDVVPRLEKTFNFDFVFNGQPYHFNMDFEGRNLPVSTSGQNMPATNLQPAEFPEAENVDYSGVNVLFWDENGSEIKMPWLEKNDQLRDKFVRSIMGNIPK